MTLLIAIYLIRILAALTGEPAGILEYGITVAIWLLHFIWQCANKIEKREART